MAQAKIEVYRPSREKPMLCSEDKNIIALACDESLEHDLSIPMLPLNDEKAICNFIIEHLIR